MTQLTISLVPSILQATLIGISSLLFYVMFRRLGGPRLGVAIAFYGLCMMSVAMLLAFSPWPNWNRVLSPRESAKLAASSQPVSWRAELDSPESEESSSKRMSWNWTVYTHEFFRELRTNHVEESVFRSPANPWLRFVAPIIIVCGCFYGFARFLIGTFAANGMKSKSRFLADARLQEWKDVLLAELKFKKNIEFRELQHEGTAATIGWWHPVILLPNDWRSWSDHQLRVVLSHEMAHIYHRDFSTLLCAQFAVAIQFFHPLAHWLSSRLRLDQELAADSVAVGLSGGRETYLNTLAEMALGQPAHSPTWAAQAFLPTRRSFLRRIEVLRNARLQSAPKPRVLKPMTCAILIAFAVGVLGIRPTGDGADSKLMAQTPKIAPRIRGAGNSAHSLEFIPIDASYAFFIRPNQILAQASSQPVRQLLASKPFESVIKDLGMHPGRIVKVTIFDLLIGENEGDPIQPTGKPAFIIHTVGDADVDALLKKHLPEHTRKKFSGFRYLVENGSGPDLRCAYRTGNRLILCSSEPTLRRVLAAGPKGARNAKWANLFNSISNSDFAACGNLNWLEAAIAAAYIPPQMANFAPLWQEAKNGVLGISVSDGLKIKARIETNAQKSAARIAESLEAARTLAKNLLPVMRHKASQGGDDQSAAALKLADELEHILDNAKIGSDGNLATVDLSSDIEFASSLTNSLLPAVVAARAAAARTQDINKVRQLLIALHNFESAHGHFPPAQVLGPDGKTVHSWRVAILPFLEKPALYERYHKNEPWDSEANQKILAQMPDLFRSTSDDDGTSETHFQVLTGKSCVFDGQEEPLVRQIQDGLSKTVMIVEAKQAVPWTKPDDIEYDPTGAIPELGGNHPGLAIIGLGDAATRVITDSTDEKVLRAIFTSNGGEPVPKF